MIVVDASVLIAHFESNDKLHDQATQLLTRVVRHGLAASPVTLAELLVGPARTQRLHRALAALDALTVVTVQLPDDAAPQLASLRAATGLKLPDCCVLLAAEQCGGDIATFDDRLATAARARGVVVHD
jgi:predicted nucleic acid-binding protein